MTMIEIPYAGGWLGFRIPTHQLGEVVTPNPIPEPAEVHHQIDQALSHPIDTVPLEALAKPGQRVAVIVDDISRPTPTSMLLPHVLERMQKAGIPKRDVAIVIALGSHREMTSEEIQRKVGLGVVKDYKVFNTPCRDRSSMRYVGDSSNGIPAEVHEWVADADLRIGIGAIVPHMDTGYSGGGKILLPGVCSCRSVNAFHARGADENGNHLGNPEAPSRIRLESFVSERIPIHFIVNVILNSDNTVYRCVAGHFIAAQRTGAAYARKVYGVHVKKRYPLVIANSYPFEIDFWQCTKAFWSGELMAADNGLVVLVSPCPEGTRTHPLWADYLGWDPVYLKAHLDSDDAEDPNACAFSVMFQKLRKRVRFACVIPTIPDSQIRDMGLTPFRTIEQAMAETVDPGRADTVAVITHAGVTVPMVIPR